MICARPCSCSLIDWKPCPVHGTHRPYHECADGEWRVGETENCLRCLDAILAEERGTDD